MANNYYGNIPSEEPNNTIPREKIVPDVPLAQPQQTPPQNEQTQPEESSQITQPEQPEMTQNTPQAEPQISAPDASTGRLVISVFTASELYPVVNAEVSISAQNGENNDVLDSSVTDRSGRTKTFTLPAPSASMSQEPTVAIPFAEYRVSVKVPNYFDAIVENVQLFGGITTQLPINLIPLPELSKGETTKVVIIPRQNL